MEGISQALEQVQNISQISLKQDTKENKKEISIYGEGQVTSKCFADCIIRIKRAFPELPNGWYEILQEMIDLERFTNDRLIDAVNNLIKNCVYPKPTIAEVLKFDKTKKSYTYDELLEITKDFSPESRKKFCQKFDFKEGRYVEK